MRRLGPRCDRRLDAAGRRGSGAGRAALLAALLAGLLGVSVRPAAAEINVCNRTSYVLTTAIGFDVKGRQVTQGWLALEPGQCRAVIDQPLEKPVFYTFGHTLPAHEGGLRYFSGNTPMCVSGGPGEFNITGQEDCERRGFVRRGFAKVDTDGGETWTTSFTEAKEYSLEEARIAGIQRLLNDTGVLTTRVDGFLGSKTRRAILDFKRAEGLAPDDALTSELYAALLAKAGTVQSETGYRFCNETQFTVWAAIGYEEQSEPVSTGWFKIAPRQCAEAIKDRLKQPAYFTYAEADRARGGPLVWGGEHVFCTMDNRFTIRGRADCEARGFLSTGFTRIDTEKRDGYVQTLTLEGAVTRRGAQR